MQNLRRFKKLKNALAINLSLLLLFSFIFSVPVMAATKDEYKQYSRITNISVNDLKKISTIYGDSFLSAAVNEYQSDTKTVTTSNDKNVIKIMSLEDPNLPVERIPISEYWKAIARGIKGQIWITKDGNFGPINHGHAGLLYGYAPYYVAFIEHGGYNYTGKNLYGETLPEGYSGITEWDNYEGTNTNDAPWTKVHTLRTYNVSTPTSEAEGYSFDLYTMLAAADYASFNLLGKGYAPLSTKDSSTTVNCSTLVYKAYKSASEYGGTSIYLGNPNSPTVIPQDLVEDTRLVLAYSVQWDGNSHVWNE